MSLTRAAGMPPISTVGQPGGRIGPPTCGTQNIDHRADVHVTGARGGHTHGRPLLPSLGRLSVFLCGGLGPGVLTGSDFQPDLEECRVLLGGLLGLLDHGGERQGAGDQVSREVLGRGDRGQIGRGQAAAAEVGRRRGAARRSVRRPAASAAGNVARRFSSFGSITQAFAASSAAAAVGDGSGPGT